MQATDSDRTAKNSNVTYSLGETNLKFTVAADTGSLYPKDGTYDYVDESVVVRAFDQKTTVETVYQVRAPSV